MSTAKTFQSKLCRRVASQRGVWRFVPVIALLAVVLTAWSNGQSNRSSGAPIVTPSGHTDELLAKLPENFAFAAAQYERMLARLTNESRFPRSYENGRHRLVNADDWTREVRTRRELTILSAAPQ